MSERQNIEIDYCPNCRGVWLDRGEMDKIIERSLTEIGAAPSRDADSDQNRRDELLRREEYHRDDYRGGGHHGGGYRRKSWLQDLFD